MSNIFTYEIDERNLRVQLKNIEVPIKEDAWQKFDAYLVAHPTVQAKTGFRGINVTLNRNVVLPAVFGLIIFLFSFLLFNFITIKNTDPQKVENTPPVLKESVATLPEVKTPVEVKKQVAPIEVPKEVIVPAPKEIVNQVAAAPVIEPQPQALSNATSEPVVQKKKRRKSLEEETLSAIKPSLVSEDEAVEAVPE